MSKMIIIRPNHSKEKRVESLELSQMPTAYEIEESKHIMMQKMDSNNYILLDKIEDIQKVWGVEYSGLYNTKNHKHHYFYLHRYSIYWNILKDKEYQELLSIFKNTRGLAAEAISIANENKAFALALSFRKTKDGKIKTLIADKDGKFPAWFSSKEEFEASKFNTEYNNKSGKLAQYSEGVVFIKDPDTGSSRQARVEPRIEDVPFYILKDLYEDSQNELKADSSSVNIEELKVIWEKEYREKYKAELTQNIMTNIVPELKEQILQELRTPEQKKDVKSGGKKDKNKNISSSENIQDIIDSEK